MAIQLFEHNQKVCQVADQMLERRGKETVVYPNGTGKREITSKPVNAHPHAPFLQMSPGAIYKQQIRWALDNNKTSSDRAPMSKAFGFGEGERTKSVQRCTAWWQSAFEGVV